MDALLKENDYEFISKQKDPWYNDFIRANEIVKLFIIKHKLIIYGGAAIEYMLRLVGDKLYSDEMLPLADYDFMSHKHAEHAYLLADELYNAGFLKTFVLLAKHNSTLRIDIGDNHFVADISYHPKETITKIPTLEFQGMHIVSPIFQYMDMHYSLSLPYNDPPMENIINRCSKDITRFNQIYKYYPVQSDITSLRVKQKVLLPLKLVYQGFSAFAIINTIFVTLKQKPIIDSVLTFKQDEILFDTYGGKYLDIIHHNPEKYIAEKKDVIRYQVYDTFLPARYETGDIRIYSSHNELVAINEIELNHVHIRLCNIQTVLKWFLGMYFADISYENQKEKQINKEIYKLHYSTLIQMIKLIEESYTEFTNEEKELAQVFFPSINTYGSDNITESQSVSLEKLNYKLYGDNVVSQRPSFYWPEQKREHPIFNYENSPIFQIGGLKID